MTSINRRRWVLAAALTTAWCPSTASEVWGVEWVEQAKLLAGDGWTGDRLGFSASISGSTAVVGAPRDDDKGGGSGSAYIFEGSSSGWTQAAKLVPHDGAAEDSFGHSVSISGTIAIVGASGGDDNAENSGSAYIFQKSGSGWTEVAKLLAHDGGAGDSFGHSVSISGTRAIIGAAFHDHNGSDSGAAYIFEETGSGWTQLAKLLPHDGTAGDWFGRHASISGRSAIVAAHGDDDNGSRSGSAYIFQDTGSGWTEVAKLLASDGDDDDDFGISVSVSGATAIVGAHRDDDNGGASGSAYMFEERGSGWTEVAKLLPDDGAAWTHFGGSVSISGRTAMVGAPGNPIRSYSGDYGSAYIFEDTGSTWMQAAKLVAHDAALDDEFGVSVSISGSTAIVGAWDDDDKGSRSGSAYIFVPEPGTLLLLAVGSFCVFLWRVRRRSVA